MIKKWIMIRILSIFSTLQINWHERYNLRTLSQYLNTRLKQTCSTHLQTALYPVLINEIPGIVSVFAILSISTPILFKNCAVYNIFCGPHNSVWQAVRGLKTTALNG